MRANDLAKLKITLRDSIMYREFLYKDADWKGYQNLWMGKYEYDDNKVLSVPILVADAQKQKADILGGNFRVEITATDTEGFAKARVLTQKINNLIEDTGLVNEIQDAVQDAITLGTGFVNHGFGSQYGTSVETVLDGFDSTRTNKKLNRIEFNDAIFDDMPWTMRTHPFDIYVPPTTIRLGTARGIFHKYIRHIDDVRDDVKLKAKHRKELQPDAGLNYAPDSSGDGTKTAAAGSRHYKTLQDYVMLWDWYDLSNNHRVTFNLNYPYDLNDEVDERMVRIDRLPFSDIIFNKNSQYYWGTSDFHLLSGQQKEINDIRTMQMIMRHQEIAKGFYNEDMIDDPEVMEEFENKIKSMATDEVMALIGVKGDPKAFFHQFTPHQQSDLDPQVRNAKDDIRDFMGMGANQRGQMSKGRHTAKEVTKVDNYHDRALTPRRRVARNVIVESVKIWVHLITDFQTEPQLVNTYDAAGNPVVVEFRGDELRGDYRFSVSVESLRAKTREDKEKEANLMLKQMAPFIKMGIVDPRSLVKQYVTRMETDWDIDALIPGAHQGQAPMQMNQFSQGFDPQQAQQRPPISMAAGLFPRRRGAG